MKTLGLALSGAAARSSFYIGFLEVLKEEGIKIDYIAAQSGATVAAAGFACGSLDVLKNWLFTLQARTLLDLIKPAKDIVGGLASLDKTEALLRELLTHGLKFEDVRPRLIFVATDLDTGGPVVLEMGDIARAIRFSCTLPGLFEPALWGNKVLVDGGLVSFIPGQFARSAGAEVVIGVNVRANRHIFYPVHLRLKKWYNAFKDRSPVNRLKSLWHHAYDLLAQSTPGEIFISDVSLSERPKGAFAILGKALDIAIDASEASVGADPNYGCDFIISVGGGKFGGNIKISDMEKLYLDGRVAAKKYLPQILKKLESKGD